ncbi:MAG: CinA family protein [candidate division KSB1 bacterium]|jgi:nicotinamide-nucleotide amidase|nr:CinA family protein [candidate division KSB1 bacterium]
MCNIYHELVLSLKAAALTVAVAESCTGGLVAKMITDVPGASSVFPGGMITYSNEMKMRLLNVRRETLEKFGAVSELTVHEMLSGLKDVLNTDAGIAISGIAGPDGGTPDKPVGTVYVGVYLNDDMLVKRYHFEGTRDTVREKSAKEAAAMLHELLTIYGRMGRSRN